MRYLPTLAIVLMFALAACSGPSGPVSPQPTGVTPDVAQPGETVTITGLRFGQDGTLTIGGSEASVTSWTETTIEAVMPESAMTGWQDLTVTTPGGSATLSGLFVGVEFDGTASELQDFLDAQAPGTAVLLQAETYDLSTSIGELIVDNKSLYGRGEDQTEIVTSTAYPAIFLTDFGERTTVADLTILGDDVRYYHGSIADVTLPAVVTAPRSRDWPTDLDELKRAWRWRGESALAVVGSVPRLTFRDVTIQEDAGGVFGAALLEAPKVDLELIGVTLDLANGAVLIASTGDVLLDDTDLTALYIEAITISGEITVVESELTIESGTFGAESGLTFADSGVLTTDGSLVLLGATNSMLTGSTASSGGPISILRSSVQSLDADLADGSATGMMLLQTQFAPIELRDNTLIRTHDDLILFALDSTIGEADIQITGNPDVRVGVFKSEDGVNFRSSDMVVATGASGLPDRKTFEENVISVTGSLVVQNNGQAGDVAMTGNVLEAGDDSPGTFAIQADGPGKVELMDNVVRYHGVAQVSAVDLVGEQLVLTGNAFEDLSDAAGFFVVQAGGGSCTIEDNQLTADDPADVNSKALVMICPVLDPTTDTTSVARNTISFTGSAGSQLSLNFDGSGKLTFVDNDLVSTGSTILDFADANLTAATNTFETGGILAFNGDAGSVANIEGNAVQVIDPQATVLYLSDVGDATLSDNTFTGVGTPVAGSTAFTLAANLNAISLVATGNTFTGFERALQFFDVLNAQNGISATINDNVFDFVIDAAPKVAGLSNVADVIDATDNRWGDNTDVTTVEGYVIRDAETISEGGDVLLDPIKLP